MRRAFCMVFCGIALVISAQTLASDSDAAGLIADSWTRFRHGLGNEQEHIKVRVERTNQAAEVKELTRWTRFDPKGDRVMIKFTQPAADRGLALLIARESGGSSSASNMWLRMPSWEQARRIASDRESRYFGGTDLTFEDNRQLMGEAVSDFSYRMLKADSTGWLIEALPKAAANSGYGKRVVQLSSQKAVVQIQYFDSSNSLVKTQQHDGVVVEPSGRWRANVIAVTNHKEGSRSRFEITARQLGVSVPERVFTQNFLAEP
jgi:hypothetical protein